MRTTFRSPWRSKDRNSYWTSALDWNRSALWFSIGSARDPRHSRWAAWWSIIGYGSIFRALLLPDSMIMIKANFKLKINSLTYVINKVKITPVIITTSSRAAAEWRSTARALVLHKTPRIWPVSAWVKINPHLHLLRSIICKVKNAITEKWFQRESL